MNRAAMRVAFVCHPAAVTAAGGAPGALHLDVATIVCARCTGRQTIFPNRVMQLCHQLASRRDASDGLAAGVGNVPYRHENASVRLVEVLRFRNEVVS